MAHDAAPHVVETPGDREASHGTPATNGIVEAAPADAHSSGFVSPQAFYREAVPREDIRRILTALVKEVGP